MSRVLITGANGFVGSRLCKVLIDSRHQLRTAIRQEYTQNDLVIKEKIVIGDIGPGTLWEAALRDVTCVVHLAARVHVMKETIADPLSEFCKVNFEGTVNLARQASITGVKRFIYLSSIKVNGETSPKGRPFMVDDPPAPIDPYAISKFKTEQALFELADTTGIEVVIIRPPLVYGPGVKANFLKMIEWLYRGIPLPFGGIHNKRSLVALDNLVDLVITCLDHPAAANQIFLAGDGEDLSTAALLQRMGRALARPAKLVPIPARLLEVAAVLVGKQALSRRLCGSLQVDISHAINQLGWEPVVTVDEALRETAEAYLEEKCS